MTFCDCGEPAEFFDKAVRTAAKPHTCCECRRTIRPGETYEKAFGKWEGCPLTFKTCDDCLDLRQAYTEAGYCFTYEHLWADHLERLTEELVAEDSPAMVRARRMVAEIKDRDATRLAEIRAARSAEGNTR